METGNTESYYVHGTSADEQSRLALLNDMLNAAALRELGLAGGERLLDVGCGLGQFSRAMARAAGPGGKAVAIERSTEQLAEARRLAQVDGETDSVEFRLADALALPLSDEEWGSFDVAHARFLLEHLRDPGAAVRGMVRAVRPGGRIVLQDDDHALMRLYPEPPGFRALWEAYVRSYDRAGNDPYIGQRLAALLHEAGAQPTRNTWLFFGSCAGNPSMELYASNLIRVLEGAREPMVSGGLIVEAYMSETLANLQEWKRRPDAAIWYAVAWAEGVRPTGHRGDRE